MKQEERMWFHPSSLSLLIMQCCAVLSTFRNLDHHQSSGDRDEVIRKARVLDSRVGDISNLSRLFLIFEFFQRYICLDLMNSSQDSQQWHVSRLANAPFYLPDLLSRQRTSAFHVGWGQSSCRAEPCWFSIMSDDHISWQKTDWLQTSKNMKGLVSGLSKSSFSTKMPHANRYCSIEKFRFEVEPNCCL